MAQRLFERSEEAGKIDGSDWVPRDEPIVQLDRNIAHLGEAEGPRRTGETMHNLLQPAEIAHLAQLGYRRAICVQPVAEGPIGIEDLEVIRAR